ARRRSLPVIIHTREATEDTFRLLGDEGAGLRVVFHCFTGGLDMVGPRVGVEYRCRLLGDEGAGLRVVFHCFTGGLDMAATALDMGAVLSFAGIVTFPKAGELRQVAQMVPGDRFLV